jgi:hypothetical protein
MPFVKQRDIQGNPKYRNIYGAGVGYGVRMRRQKVNPNPVRNAFSNFLNSDLFKTGANKLLNFGMEQLDKNKDKITKVLQDKAGDMVNKIVQKTKESDAIPDSVKKSILNNSDIVNSYSSKLIEDLVNKGHNKTKNTIYDIQNNIAPAPPLLLYGPTPTLTTNKSEDFVNVSGLGIKRGRKKGKGVRSVYGGGLKVL